MKDISVDAVASPLTSKQDLLLQLADRCEREEPSRELDAEIGIAIRDRPVGKLNAWIDENFPTWRPHATPGRIEVVHNDGKGGVHWEVLPYTTSLDAAVTLVPEDYSYDLTFSAAGDGAMRRARLWDWKRGPLMVDPTNEHTATAKTLPLAVCAAALRARAGATQ